MDNSFFNPYILSVLILIPILGAGLILILPRVAAKPLGLLISVANFLFALHLIAHWNSSVGTGGFHYQNLVPWLPQLGINFHVGIDGLSLWMILLTVFLTPVLFLTMWDNLTDRVKGHVALLLLLEGFLIGVFSSIDVMVFYIFWEAVLIPIYLLMIGWGGPGRIRAAIKLFIYTMLGSVLMWVAMMYLYFHQANPSFDYSAMLAAAHSLDAARGTAALALFGAFAVAFAIKVPMFPLHTWQPDAYSESPVSATVMLAAVLSKMGIYGFIRFAIPFFPKAAAYMAPLFIILGIIAIIYGAMVAIRQTDFKRLLAYSSISHLGLIVAAIFAATLATQFGEIALSGAVLQMLAHGVTIAALFLLMEALQQRRGTRDIAQFGGLAKRMPFFSSLFWIALFASIGFPGLCSFVGEYLMLQGMMQINFIYAFLACTTVIWGAIYMLRLFGKLMFGEITHEENVNIRDLHTTEGVALVLVLAMTVWIGVLPQHFLDPINNTARNFVATYNSNSNLKPNTKAALPEKDRLAQR
ncbi:MAG: NADH-quinone oxidoreductase subunit M [Abditibacteriaceae bacterium]